MSLIPFIENHLTLVLSDYGKDWGEKELICSDKNFCISDLETVWFDCNYEKPFCFALINQFWIYNKKTQAFEANSINILEKIIQISKKKNVSIFVHGDDFDFPQNELKCRLSKLIKESFLDLKIDSFHHFPEEGLDANQKKLKQGMLFIAKLNNQIINKSNDNCKEAFISKETDREFQLRTVYEKRYQILSPLVAFDLIMQAEEDKKTQIIIDVELKDNVKEAIRKIKSENHVINFICDFVGKNGFKDEINKLIGTVDNNNTDWIDFHQKLDWVATIIEEAIFEMDR